MRISLKKNVLKTWTGYALVMSWGVGLTYLIATMMVGHWVSMPRPQVGETAPFEMFSFAQPQTKENAEAVSVFHFLYGSCPCSRRVLKQVVSREPIDGARERIVLIGEDPENEKIATELGYEVDCVDPVVLKSKYGVESAPLLMVVDANARILYSGGYTSRKQGLDIRDQEIICGIIDGTSIDSLPLYGCAVSKELREILDPLNIKTLTIN